VGIKKSRGEFIAFLDDDDEWLPDKLEKQVKVFENSTVGLVTCYSLDKRVGREGVIRPPDSVSFRTLLLSFAITTTSSFLIRKRVLEETGLFDPELPASQEYDLALRIAKKYGIRTVPKILMVQNPAPGHISEKWLKKIRSVLAIRKKYDRDYNRLGFVWYVLIHIKIVTLIVLFSLGFVFGNSIYRIINPLKKLYGKLTR
jgi:glycosyltransferase involved in cell wall biosynthesis